MNNCDQETRLETKSKFTPPLSGKGRFIQAAVTAAGFLAAASSLAGCKPEASKPQVTATPQPANRDTKRDNTSAANADQARKQAEAEFNEFMAKSAAETRDKAIALVNESGTADLQTETDITYILNKLTSEQATQLTADELSRLIGWRNSVQDYVLPASVEQRHNMLDNITNGIRSQRPNIGEAAGNILKPGQYIPTCEKFFELQEKSENPELTAQIEEITNHPFDKKNIKDCTVVTGDQVVKKFGNVFQMFARVDTGIVSKGIQHYFVQFWEQATKGQNLDTKEYYLQLTDRITGMTFWVRIDCGNAMFVPQGPKPKPPTVTPRPTKTPPATATVPPEATPSPTASPTPEFKLPTLYPFCYNGQEVEMDLLTATRISRQDYRIYFPGPYTLAELQRVLRERTCQVATPTVPPATQSPTPTRTNTPTPTNTPGQTTSQGGPSTSEQPTATATVASSQPGPSATSPSQERPSATPAPTETAAISPTATLIATQLPVVTLTPAAATATPRVEASPTSIAPFVTATSPVSAAQATATLLPTQTAVVTLTPAAATATPRVEASPTSIAPFVTATARPQASATTGPAATATLIGG